MLVVVTGSEGSLMQWTIKHLLDNGHEVIGVDNHARYDDYGHTTVVPSSEYEFRAADLSDPDAAESVLVGADAVIDAAALIYGVKGFHEHAAAILSNDITVHRNVLEGARTHGVERVAYISSSMVYERDDPPHHEADVWDAPVPSTDYGLSKLIGERYSRAFADHYGVDYTVWRPFNIITPYEKAAEEAGESHVFADFLRKLLVDHQNPMEIFGTGEQVRCFTWIDDVAGAIADHSFDDSTRNDTYNLANPEPVTMKELARRIFRRGRERGWIEDTALEFDHVNIYEDDVTERVPSVEKAEATFDWAPTVRLDEALDRCIDHVPDLYGLET